MHFIIPGYNCHLLYTLLYTNISYIKLEIEKSKLKGLKINITEISNILFRNHNGSSCTHAMVEITAVYTRGNHQVVSLFPFSEEEEEVIRSVCENDSSTRILKNGLERCSQPETVLPLESIWQCRETFWVITAGEGWVTAGIQRAEA